MVEESRKPLSGSRKETTEPSGEQPQPTDIRQSQRGLQSLSCRSRNQHERLSDDPRGQPLKWSSTTNLQISTKNNPSNKMMPKLHKIYINEAYVAFKNPGWLCNSKMLMDYSPWKSAWPSCSNTQPEVYIEPDFPYWACFVHISPVIDLYLF